MLTYRHPSSADTEAFFLEHHALFRGAGGRHGARFFSGEPHHYHMMHGAQRFLKALLGVATTAFFLSIAIRLLAFFVAILVSPTVLLLALATFTFHSGLCPQSHVQSLGPRFNEDSNQKSSCGPRMRGRCQRAFLKNRRKTIVAATIDQNDDPSDPVDSDHIEQQPEKLGRCDTAEKTTCYQNKVIAHHDDTAEKLNLSFDVPGYADDNINVSVEDENELVVSGSRTNRIGETFSIQERFALDQEVFDIDSVQGQLFDGVLEVSIQKKPAPQPRIVPISSDTKNKSN